MRKYKLLKDWGDKKAGQIIDLTEADAKTLVDTGFAQEIDSNVVGIIQAAVAESIQSLSEGIATSVKTALGEIVKDIEKEGIHVVTGGKDRREDSPTFGYPSFGAFAMDVRSFCGNKGISDNLKLVLDHQSKALIAAGSKAAQGVNEAVGEEGGILIPEQYSSGIWARAKETVDLLGRVQSIPITGNTYTILEEQGDTMAAGVRNAGVRGYWVEEAGQITKSAPKFKRSTMRLHKLGVLVYVTDEQLEDSPTSMDAFLTTKAGDEIGFMTGDALINGDGIGKPQGVMLAPCLVTITAETGQAADTVVTENIVKMYSRMYGPSRRNAVWCINQDTEPQLLTLTIAVGTGGWPLMMPPGGLGNAPNATMLGKSALPTPWNPTLGDTGDVMLADWSQYMIITKGGIKSAVSIHLRFDYDETAFRFTYRVDGRATWANPLTPYKGTAKTQSPFIVIAAR